MFAIRNYMCDREGGRGVNLKKTAETWCSLLLVVPGSPTELPYTANEGPVTIQYKCLVPIYVLP